MSTRRYEITDEQWQRIEHLLPGKASDPGHTAENNRRFIWTCDTSRTPCSGSHEPAPPNLAFLHAASILALLL